MKLSVIFLLFLLISRLANAQETNLEQRAFNYFLTNIYQNEYDDIRVTFSGRTETKTDYLTWFEEIDSVNYKLREAINPNDTQPAIDIQAQSPLVKIKKHRIANKPKLYIYPKIPVKDKYFIYIGVYKRFHFVGHHLLEYDRTGNLLNTYYRGEII